MADRVTVIGWDGSALTDAARAALGRPPWWPAPPITSRCPKCRGTPSGSARAASTSPPGDIAGHRGTAVVLADGDPASSAS